MKKLKQAILYSTTVGIFIAIGFFLAVALVPQLSGATVSAIDETGAPIVAANDILLAQEATYNQIYDSVAPSVVSVVIEGRRSDNGQWQRIGSGSGFVVDVAGHIVTNNHVVAAAEFIEQILGEGSEARIEISMFDGTVTSAEIVGTDPDSDIAVLQVDVPQDRLVPVSFADSSQLDEGQIVFALGNPFSNDWTMTSGIISALNRSIPSLDSFQTGGVIQTDTAINPGNSGGPLVNLGGQVIGVNAQINSESGSNSGVGFAIPSNLVVRVATALIENGTVEYSYIGISSGEIGLAAIDAYDLPNNLRGVAVIRVESGSPADEAGLHSASDDSLDVITAINGEAIDGFDELIGYLGIYTEPGDVVTLTVYRDGETLDMDVELTNRPN